MKRLFLLTAVVSFMVTSTAWAQDDMYFVPSKKTAKNSKENRYSQRYGDNSEAVYHSGSNRDVDEYNRRGAFASHYDYVGNDSIGNDIIEFTPGNGVYPDSASIIAMVNDSVAAHSKAYKGSGYNNDDDYTITIYLSRFDDFYGPYWAWNRFHSPWYYDPFYDPWFYDPFYDPWFDPWYRPGYWPGGWRPYWRPGYWPGYWHGGGVIVHNNGGAGTHNHGNNFSPRRGTSFASNSRNMSRGVQSRAQSDVSRQERSNISTRRSNFNAYNQTNTERRSFEPTRNNTPSYNTPSRSTLGGSSFGGNIGGGSRGGSFGGGSRGGSIGGGSRGGGRR